MQRNGICYHYEYKEKVKGCFLRVSWTFKDSRQCLKERKTIFFFFRQESRSTDLNCVKEIWDFSFFISLLATPPLILMNKLNELQFSTLTLKKIRKVVQRRLRLANESAVLRSVTKQKTARSAKSYQTFHNVYSLK